MNVLVIGSGGREHALCWSIAKSPMLERLFCSPGNGGMAEMAHCVALPLTDPDGIAEFCRNEDIGLVVVGPEAPLVDGLADALTERGVRVFGPSAAAAALEGSKGFTKDLCARHGIPTAAYRRFTALDEAAGYVREKGAPIVVKADGLAAGKGVVVAATEDEAEQALEEIFGGKFGDAGAEVVVEACLEGEEASYFALVSGETVVPLIGAQDHKRLGDGDTGPNTGGMGAYSPAPVLTPEIETAILERIIRPTAKAMVEEGRPYRGLLYAGLMITGDGPQLIEYNVRFGDPECQVLCARLESDLLPALIATADGSLDDVTLSWREEAALTVVMAARGYPGKYERGSEIHNLKAASKLPGVVIFHAGTRRDGLHIFANGGRVLNVTGLGRSVHEARDNAYAAVDAIEWEGGFCRRDIGWRAVARDSKS